MEKHTPTPELNFETPLRIEYDDACEMYSLRDYKGGIIARIRANDPELPAFIVRAVNNFDEMLNALKQVQIIVDAEGGMDRLGVAISKVIAKAEAE